MSEFRIHHDVNELLSLLHVRGGDGAEGYIDLLQKHRTPYVNTTVSSHSAKVKLAEFSKTPEDFLRKYEELKSKNVRNLDPLVYLLSKLCEDKETLQFLQQNAKERSESSTNTTATTTTSYSLPQTSTKMSMQELDELRKKLGNVTASSNAPLPAEVTRKMLRDKHNKKNPTLPNPVFPNWVYDRPALLGDFITSSGPSGDPAVAIGTMPLPAQEQALVEDLLFVLVGVDGRDITAQPVLGRQNRSFIVDSTLDMSIKELVNRILPVASYYSTITRFIEEKSSFEYGQVNHALTAAMRTLMKEYLILVTQLEHLQRQGLLSLQKLWFYIQPTMRTMEILASIASSVDKGECMGGATLSLLHDRTFNYTGDSQAQELCLYLTKAASVPYFEILEKWTYRGIIKDPYSEFMVEEHELQKEKIQEDYNDKYWDQRYTIVQHRIPSFLQKMADKILSTGKYLNVVRECGRDVTCPDAKEVLYTLKERAYVEQIEKAYNYASKVLLDFLMEEKELVLRLRSIKHYFLMDKGDFFVHFMDLTEEELKKPVDDIVPPRLEALLELALRMSTANTDPFKDDLKIDLMPHDVITQLLRVLAIETKQEKAIINAEPTEVGLSGLEAFSFDYIVKWPLSLIINRKALTRYQMLFRHIFYCKHVERLLCNVWICNKDFKLYSSHCAKWFAAAFALRQRMLNFVQNIQYYMMFEVMEPTWHIMENNLKTASNIDDVLCHHTSFLDNCLKDCMLTNPELLRIFSKLMSVCVMFTSCMQRFTQSKRLERLSKEQGTMDGPPTEREHAEEAEKKRLNTKLLPEHADTLQSDAGFETSVSKFDSSFSTLLLDLLDKLSIYSTNDCEHSMISIIYRLDFNGFYTERLEKMAIERSQKASATLDGFIPVICEAAIRSHRRRDFYGRLLVSMIHRVVMFTARGEPVTEQRAPSWGTNMFSLWLIWVCLVQSSAMLSHVERYDVVTPRRQKRSLQDNQEHCYYQGHIEGNEGLFTVCDYSGYVRAQQQVYLIEPLGQSEEGGHAVYRPEDLKTINSSSNTPPLYDQDQAHDPRLSSLFRSRSRKTQPVAGPQKFVELFVVVDNTEYKLYGSETKSRVLGAINHVDKLYRALNIRVMLVGLEIWTYRDYMDVDTNSETTLDHFLLWRQADLLKRIKHDNAQFVTGKDFDGNTVGLANKFAMCTENSGGVNQDHHGNPIGLASTIAHEMGHKLWLPSCLSRPSSITNIAAGPSCGNNLLDPGEECDCGPVEECQNPCCDAWTCRLTEGFQCAQGECCNNCQLQPAGGVCRESASDCDLPEYCTGESEQCPEDSFEMNGKPCYDQAHGYCSNGQCPTHQQHCWRLFGQEEASPSQVKRADFRLLGLECKLAVDDDKSRNIDMVPKGTKCGPNKVCLDNRCVDISVYGKKEDCSKKCNNNGYADLPQVQSGIIAGVCAALSILLTVTVVTAGLMCCKKDNTDNFTYKRKGNSAPDKLNPIFQDGSVKDRPQISAPTFMASTATQAYAPLVVTVTPSRAAPQATPLPPSLPPPSKAQVESSPQAALTRLCGGRVHFKHCSVVPQLISLNAAKPAPPPVPPVKPSPPPAARVKPSPPPAARVKPSPPPPPPAKPQTLRLT
ncbi:hypothetical protein KUCAC02_027331 [Chaenocephalus aceratus]|uniref:Uncharacterized protein n=1 Tax=Chaenocephalus aceratus TaxID=36190 RepID=A0ACB9W4B3_CHAAC|nr:hypothetical protein KUCAC02_027331 [Chaenocephalus aceratus]